MAAAGTAAAVGAPPPLHTVGTHTASREPRQLFMTTNNPSVDASTNECLFHSATGELVFRWAKKRGA